MAPFRGNRGRGRGSRGRGSRGGRGGASRGGGTEKIARSGIKTRSGYRKFDSQRIKDTHASESEHEEEDEQISDGEESESSDSEDEELQQPVQAYNALLQSFQQSAGPVERPAKRRKIAEMDADTGAHSSNEGSDAELEANDILEDADADIDALDVDEADVVLDDGDEEEASGSSDPYQLHFADPEDHNLKKGIESGLHNKWDTKRSPLKNGSHLTFSMLSGVKDDIALPSSMKSIGAAPLKKRLAESAKQHLDEFDGDQSAIAPYLMGYSDLLVGSRTPQNASSLRTIACLHAINHVLKGRDRVLKNNARLAHMNGTTEELDLRDQGFTRPKVLILLETRQLCASYATEIVDLFQPEQQENVKRFRDAFQGELGAHDDRPDDYRDLFDGNNDNNFLATLKFTRKTLKFYSAFYASDIILASPLGLRRVIENDDVKKRDHDFLSSIEMAIVDQADAMQMQNWQNVEVVFDHLNLQLNEAHGCDFSRVRNWYLDGHAKYLRQTIVFGAYITPEMNRLYNGHMSNIAGKAKLTPSYTSLIGTIPLGLKQTFSRFDCVEPSSDPDARFKYFTSAILPSLLRLPKPADGAQGIVIFIPSYYDFLRVRNYFAASTATENVSFGAIHDYSAVGDQRRARSHFLTGRHSILLYTQRAHHFFRLKIRGVKRVVMYGLPDNPVFYQEVVGGYIGTGLSEGKITPLETSVRCLFNKWDGLRLERVAGSQRVSKMLTGMGDTYEFL